VSQPNSARDEIHGAQRLGLSSEEVLTTTRSVRRRLDFERPVDRATLMRCLDWALQAPNGSNRQRWTWLFVGDSDRKRAIADVYRRNFDHLMATMYADPADREAAGFDSGRHLALNLERCPVLLVPFIAGRYEGATSHIAASVWGSILPAVWSFMLALREHGIGAAWTTVHLGWDGERDVAEIVGAPFDEVTQAGLFPIAYTIGTDFRPAMRRPAAEVARFDDWST
jgi:nitroreductase